jgi:DNA-binding response OmpR family regulator
MGNILVIDDEANLRAGLRDILEGDGHTVDEASNGLVGMQKFKETQYDLVITDIIMPDQEGFQTIQQMRRINPDQKIIAMSGGGRMKSIEFLQIAESLGAVGAIKKPFGPSVVRDAVRACLPPPAEG